MSLRALSRSRNDVMADLVPKHLAGDLMVLASHHLSSHYDHLPGQHLTCLSLITVTAITQLHVSPRLSIDHQHTQRSLSSKDGQRDMNLTQSRTYGGHHLVTHLQAFFQRLLNLHRFNQQQLVVECRQWTQSWEISGLARKQWLLIFSCLSQLDVCSCMLVCQAFCSFMLGHKTLAFGILSICLELRRSPHPC